MKLLISEVLQKVSNAKMKAQKIKLLKEHRWVRKEPLQEVA